MNNKTIDRNSSIELLRIITMIGVVIIHYNNIGFKCVEDYSVNYYFLYFTDNMFICAVDLFVLISAYFLSVNQQRKLIKVMELFVHVIAFNLAFYFIGLLGGNEFSLKSFIGRFIPSNYFVVLYFALYLISPYINILVNKLNKSVFKRLVILLVLLFSVCTIIVDFLENLHGESIIGLSTIGKYGSQHGYSIVNFVLLYFVGAYIRLNNVNLSKKKACMGMIINLAILYTFSLIEHRIGLSSTTSWNYNNPFVILMAVFVLLFFINIKMQSRIVNELAKGAFTCFLFHGAFLSRLQIEKFVGYNLGVLILHQFGSAIILYILSYIIYKIYYVCSNWFIKLISRLCSRIDVSVQDF